MKFIAGLIRKMQARGFRDLSRLADILKLAPEKPYRLVIVS
jgi:hypothetical protein